MKDIKRLLDISIKFCMYILLMFCILIFLVIGLLEIGIKRFQKFIKKFIKERIIHLESEMYVKNFISKIVRGRNDEADCSKA